MHAWWVGLPALNRIYRCLGDYCSQADTPTNSPIALGASLATSGSMLVVGAPGYVQGSYQGAVLIVNLDDVDAGLVGEEQLCGASGTPCCTSNLDDGVCVGRVFCYSGGSTGSAACRPDAGTDAGVDAGTMEPADAGVTPQPPGAVTFEACGCTAANGGFIILALAALMLRRRVSP